MPTLYKYLVKEILKYFCIILASVIVIYLSVDFFEKIDDFIEVGLPSGRALSYFVLKIPFIIAQIMPVGILLAVLVVFGLMNRNNEMMALRAGGISVRYLMIPVVLKAVLFTLFLFFISEEIVPVTMDKANRIWRNEVRKESTVASREKNIWIKGSRVICHVNYYNPVQKSIFDVTMTGFDQEFKLIRRVDAREGKYLKGEWLLFEVMEQHLEKETNTYRTEYFDQKVEALPFSPEDLQRAVKKSEEMSFIELRDFTRKVEEEGYDATHYRVDLNAKIAFPFVCIIMSLLGIGISLKRISRDELSLKIAIGVGVAFLYWILYSFCISLGYGERLPPAVAAWAANFIFLCLAVFNLVTADY
jgi:lipopolysaccharide export system permease protein